jgi:hypothetical protein
MNISKLVSLYLEKHGNTQVLMAALELDTVLSSVSLTEMRCWHATSFRLMVPYYCKARKSINASVLADSSLLGVSPFVMMYCWLRNSSSQFKSNWHVASYRACSEGRSR